MKASTGRVIVLLLIGTGLASAGVLTRVAVPYGFVCGSSEPMLIDNARTGFRTCKSGLLFREHAQVCPSLLPRPDHFVSRHASSLQGWSHLRDRPDPDKCHRDSDCTLRPHGHCIEPLPSGFMTCSYGCVRDEECKSDELCRCDEPIGRCVAATCRDSDQCGLLAVCAETAPSPGCWFENGFACQTQQDECAVDADCPNGDSCGWETGHRTCVSGGCMY